ncbi:MAG: DUF1648 domain-containing protein [Sarcina sp.]
MLIQKKYKVLDIFLILFIIALMLGTIFECFSLPSQIPSHIDSNGIITSYNSKYLILILALIGSLLGFSFFKLAQYPEMHSTLFKITELNKKKQYSITSNLCRSLGIEIVLLFAYAIYYISTQSNFNGIYIILGITIITFMFFAYKSYKYK